MIRQGIAQLIDRQALSIGEVFEASDGEAALALVREKHPQIVLADINMPRLDGLALAQAIKAMDRDIQVALITGYDYFDYAVQAIKAGVDDYLLKPVSRQDIQELLTRLTSSLREIESEKAALATLADFQHLTASSATNEKDQDLPILEQDYRTQILKALDQSLSDPDLSLTSLASQINLSAGYLSELFKRIFGIPFQDYLIHLRLERAKILLLSTGKKVYEIARDVGFEDPNYFSTRFRKHVGQTPNQFREEKTGGAS